PLPSIVSAFSYGTTFRNAEHIAHFIVQFIHRVPVEKIAFLKIPFVPDGGTYKKNIDQKPTHLRIRFDDADVVSYIGRIHRNHETDHAEVNFPLMIAPRIEKCHSALVEEL